MEWQPIETAPKDGTPHVRGLWVCDATSGYPLYWQVDAGCEHTDDGDWILSDGYTSGWHADDYSHWMPLPEPPQYSTENV